MPEYQGVVPSEEVPAESSIDKVKANFEKAAGKGSGAVFYEHEQPKPDEAVVTNLEEITTEDLNGMKGGKLAELFEKQVLPPLKAIYTKLIMEKGHATSEQKHEMIERAARISEIQTKAKLLVGIINSHTLHSEDVPKADELRALIGKALVEIKAAGSTSELEKKSAASA